MTILEVKEQMSTQRAQEFIGPVALLDDEDWLAELRDMDGVRSVRCTPFVNPDQAFLRVTSTRYSTYQQVYEFAKEKGLTPA